MYSKLKDFINDNADAKVTCERLLGCDLDNITDENVVELLSIFDDIQKYGMSCGVEGFIYHSQCKAYLQSVCSDDLFSFVENMLCGCGVEHGNGFFHSFDIVNLLEASLNDNGLGEALAIHSSVAWEYVYKLVDEMLEAMNEDEDDETA